MASTLVTTINVTVYGDDNGRYLLFKIDEKSFGRWAIETLQLLTAHNKLAKEKLLPRDSVTPAAKNALWNTYPALSGIPRDYEDAAMATATSTAGVNNRVLWNAAWLKQIAQACAPDQTLQVLQRIRDVRFGETGTGEKYTSRDVLRYSATLYELQDRLGPAMTDVPDKRKLDAVKKCIPVDLRRILEDTCPCNAGADAAPYVDSWEKGLARVAKEMKTVEDSKVVAAALARKPSRNMHAGAVHRDQRFGTPWKGGGRGRHDSGRGFQEKRAKRGGGKSPSRAFPFKQRKPFGRNSGQTPSAPVGDGNARPASSNARESGRDVSTVRCFKCGRMGHYANECPEASVPGERKGGGGRGNGKRSGSTNAGRGAGKRE